jgi:hypothetical protein
MRVSNELGRVATSIGVGVPDVSSSLIYRALCAPEFETRNRALAALWVRLRGDQAFTMKSRLSE